MKNIQKSLLAALIVAGYAVNTQAAVTGQVDVKLNISTGCTVGGSQTEGNMNKFGTLDFGKTSGTWNNVLTAEVASAATGGNISVTCDGTDPVDFTVAMIYAELSGDFPLGDSRQPIYKSLRPFDLVS